MPHFVRTFAAVCAAFVLSIGGANAAQHQDKSNTASPLRLSIPAIISPVGDSAQAAVSEKIVVAQRRRRVVVRRGGYRRGRNVAIGVGAAALTLGVLGAAAAARADDGGASYCRRMRWRCDDGDRSACRRYYRSC